MTSRIVIQFAGWRKYQSNADDFPSLLEEGGWIGVRRRGKRLQVTKSFYKVYY
jgi:hypothetical protein